MVKTKPTIQDSLIAAIIHVESRGDSMAYNAGEDAVGVLQIRPIMVREVNRLLKENKYTLADRWNKSRSIEMFNVIKDHTTNPTNKILARNWNGGWNGYKKKSTLKYWQKVKRKL
jgi:soluble lytic murein transglycosylase-like protein